MIGPTLAGWTIDHLGHRPAWGVIFGFMIATGLAFAALIGPGHFTAHPSAGTRRARRLGELFNVPALVAILASFVVIFTLGARTTFFPVYVRGLDFSATSIGVLLSVRAAVTLATRLLMRRILILCGGRFPSLLISMTGLAFGVGLTPFCRDAASLMGLSVLVGVGVGVALPLSMAAVTDGVRPEDRGLAMGVRLSGNRLAQLLNPLLFGLLIHGFGISAAFWVGGCCSWPAPLPSTSGGEREGSPGSAPAPDRPPPGPGPAACRGIDTSPAMHFYTVSL
jgi:MFS family permease